jgi:glycosyltransferase involved in cell wall biosynthesis
MKPSSLITPRRVALTIETNGPGGAENMMVHLAEGLRSEGIEVVPVIRASSERSWLERRFNDVGFAVETVAIRRAVDPTALTAVREIVERRRVELVHSHEFTMGVYGRVASMLAGVAHVITMHGGTGFAAAARRRWALGWALRHSEGRVAVSDTAAEFLAHSCRVRRELIDVIPNGVNVSKGDRSRLRSELGLEETQRLILAVGNLYPVKGHAVLVEAAALLKEMPVPWVIAIAGRGGEEAALRAAIDRLDLAGRVHLLGLRTDVPDLLAAADVFVMPSRSEGLPLALLEAMSAGLPVVASAVGGIPSVVRDGITGRLVPAGDPALLGDALRDLITDPSTGRLGATAAEEIPRVFGVKGMTDRYISLYGSSVRLKGIRQSD